MALDPADRYGAVPELQSDLEAYQHGFATVSEVLENGLSPLTFSINCSREEFVAKPLFQTLQALH